MLKYDTIQDMATKAVIGSSDAPQTVTQLSMIRILLEFGLEVAEAAEREIHPVVETLASHYWVGADNVHLFVHGGI